MPERYPIRPLLQVPLWIEEVHQQEGALVSTLRDQLDPRAWDIAVWNSDRLRFSLGGLHQKRKGPLLHTKALFEELVVVFRYILFPKCPVSILFNIIRTL